MRSLSKSPEIINSATYIEQYLKQRLTQKERKLLLELETLEKDKAMFKTIQKGSVKR